ncbi:unnamed protein product, partial [Ixodes persulcatus]
ICLSRANILSFILNLTNLLQATQKSSLAKKAEVDPERLNFWVVYRIPLTCGRVYIGQTGRCINDR